MLKLKALFLGLTAVLVAGFALGGQAIPNWSAPATWTPPRSAGAHTMTDITFMVPFIGVTPCRVADTRGNGFSGTYGPPSIAANTTRSFTIAGVCGIPATAMAVSFNFGALNVGAPGDLRVFPAGASVPLVSTLNYNANTPAIANAAIVPLGTGGAITVQADATTIDLIIDVNGYYGPIPAAVGNFFPIQGSVGSGVGVIEGFNVSASANTFGVLGEITLASPGGSSTGVRGVNMGTGGSGIGVWGSQAGSGFGVLGQVVSGLGVFGETTGTSGIGVAVYGLSTSGNGVVGTAAGASGVHFGVYGDTESNQTGAAGVQGASLGGLTNVFGGALGVFGNDGTASGIGVLAISQNRGVQGARVNSAGSLQSSGVVGYAGTSGLHSFSDITAAGTKSFIAPHPSDPSKQIDYVSLEGNEAGTYFRGRGHFVNGRAIIPVPQDFQMVTEDDGLTVQITPIGRMAQVGVVSMDLYHIMAEASRDVDFSYLVQGVRRGYAGRKPIQDNVYFVPATADAKMDSWPQQVKDTLIRLGIYNSDGTVNMETAERMGWAQKWREDAEREKAIMEARKSTADALRSQQ